MKSGGGVLIIAALQLAVGVSLLGVYEAYKTNYFNSTLGGDDGGHLSDAAEEQLVAERNFLFRTPLDFIFWFSCINNICALFGLAGIFTGQPTLVTIFFSYNLVQMVVSFNQFVDVVADQKIRYVGEAATVSGYEKAAAGLLFTNCALSMGSIYFTARAVSEIKQKQREAYQSMSVVGDTLNFEPDLP